ncbi:MAG: hypothetical protein KUF79_20520 [Candidatus Thiodiazotropha sp. (ex Ctena orbiculata)]|nr:hypothetical protein [Candidatus Thiodiazotropha taylori]
MNKRKLAEAWIHLQDLPQDSTEAEKYMWSAEEINLLALRSPSDCWDVVLEILSITDDDWIITNLGAGPIENMLAFKPEITISMIENEYTNNSKLQAAIKNTWKNIIPDEVWDRLSEMKSNM